ncbi:MAG TPA: hypothetical protein VMN78_12120 [Longimicrobiales bacterium]|nr:hypothetical protein [Longimicrobiales bacterium]
MAARAIWKAQIDLGEISVPVKLYSAVSDRTVHFRLLDPDTLTPISQRMVDSESGEAIRRSA